MSDAGQPTSLEAPTGEPCPPTLSVLVVEDDADFLESMSLLIEREGFSVRSAHSLSEARAALADDPPDVVFVDLKLPDGEGVDLLRDRPPDANSDFVVITGHASVDSAVDSLRQGALDYLTKPPDLARLKIILANVRRTRELRGEVHLLRRELRELGRFGPLVGRSPEMQEIYDLITRVAPTDATVLILGESGTGKELVAETIHRLSPRCEGPFLPVKCGAIPKEVIESELFGHEKGSFTGADRSRRGHFEEASGGVLFLDEVGQLPVELQVKLLRVLETDQVMRVGSSSTTPVDVRVLAATNQNPAEAVRKGILREDLYYRLNVFPITLPPLRERGDDVLLIAEAFLESMNREKGTTKRWSDRSRDRLRSYRWPGNVRELRNVTERTFILSDEILEPDLVPLPTGTASRGADGETVHVDVGSSLQDAERSIILATLRSLDGDKRRAADVLGISLKTLYNRLKVYAASRPDEGDATA
jgi:two-component system response regulator AtoC